MDIATFLGSLESTGLAVAIRESLYLFPVIESLHVIGLTTVFGTVAILDLRLLGLASIHRPFTKVASDVLRWTWAAFALTVTTGLLMFITNASGYYSNLQFRSKMALLALGGINMLIFDLTTGRSVHRWDEDAIPPFGGRLAGALSLLFWIGVIFLGRWVGFTTGGHVTPSLDINLDNLFK
jgi:hypothetical protein